ncbi:hypothetical protein DFH08DRAFT_894976 [Mycena albidolilacea]|uniref:Uncharacterized protein n=1 Tax=Mycena albidolilacea TaxID=1033008 RepID=A0AAD7EDD8_9AGAR|nr:hypothetical protein DFH08DRAFT_894976 [Mycena albidolilacea]
MMKQAQYEGTGPAHANVPRRAKVLTAAQVRARRRRERGMQELGRASGVFVAFESASAEDINEDREEFGAVVRIQASSAGGETWCEEETGKVLRLVVARGARDDGVPCLEPAQLRAACAFVGKHREGGSRVLITTPRERAVDALSVGVCCATTISPDLEQVNSNGDIDMDAEEDVHQLLVRWHDLPTDDRDEDEDGDHGGGLRDEWRGLLSRDGIEYLAAALFPAPPCPCPSPSTSTPPSPSPFSSPSPFFFPSPSSSSSSPPSSPPPASSSMLHDPPRPIDTADA